MEAVVLSILVVVIYFILIYIFGRTNKNTPKFTREVIQVPYIHQKVQLNLIKKSQEKNQKKIQQNTISIY